MSPEPISPDQPGRALEDSSEKHTLHPQLFWDWQSDTKPPREIRAGAVLPSQLYPGRHRIEAITAKGREVYEGALQVESGDVQSDHTRAINIFFRWAAGQRWALLKQLAQEWDRDVAEELADITSELRDEAGKRPDTLLRLLFDARGAYRRQFICEAEVTQFDGQQRESLLPLLWQYILENRDNNDRDELVAVGSAIRKYVALMPMERMGELAVLLESGHRSPLPIELEIEVAKMIYRNFEVHPPLQPDPQPQLSERLWELVQAYINPRVLLRDKHSAATSLAIEAIVAMRSPLAEHAWRAAHECSYRWFAEIVSDDLEELREHWNDRSREAAVWLDDLRERIAVDV